MTDGSAVVNGREYRLPSRPTVVITTDRIGDLSVGADARATLGKSAAKHDLSLVEEGLRSHGGRHEQIVPIITSHPLTERFAAWHRTGVQSRDLHDLVLNGLE